MDVVFRGLYLRAAPGFVMMPRPASEGLVDAAAALVGERSARVADVGTGSGAIAVAPANELPVAPGTVPSPVDGTCPAGARAASYLVRDNGGTLGVVSIVVVPAGGDPNAPMPLDLPSVDGSARATAPTGSGGQLIVVSQPQQGATSAPFADRINQIASQLATRY
jgi:hypothetical protein